MFSKMDKNFNEDFFYECLFEVYINFNFSLQEVVLSINMDVYMLLRYLHPYDEIKINRVSKASSLNNDKNSIIHTGTAHSKIFQRKT